MNRDALDRVNDSLAARDARSVAVTPDGAYLLARTDEEGVAVDLATGEEVATFPAHRHLPPTPAADGATFATYDGEAVQVRGLPGCDPVAAFAVDASALAPGGRNFLAPGGEWVYLPDPSRANWTRYDPATGDATRTYPAPADDEAVACFALSADGTRVAVAGIESPVSEGFVAIYDAAAGDLLGHEALAYEVDRVALSPDGSDVVLADGIGGVVGVGLAVDGGGSIDDDADRTDGAPVDEDGSGDRGIVDGGWRVTDPDGTVADVQFVRGGREVVTATVEGTLARLDAARGERTGSHPTEGPVASLSATGAGDLVALSGERARVVAPEWSE